MSEMSSAPAAPALVLLEERAVIAIGGADAPHFLHNLLSADIEGLEPGRGTLAALLTPQGKIIADMLVFDASDDTPLYLVDVAKGFADDLADRLRRYRLRADVAIDPLGPGVAVAALLDAPPAADARFYAFPDPRSGALGQRLIGPRDALEGALPAAARLSAAHWHARRVRLGIPEGGKDFMGQAVYPHEVNFDRLGGVDFRKGCYIGQEVVSRMEHRGTARTRALPVRLLNGFGVLGGAEIQAGGREIGRIGECFGDRGIAILRLDRLQEALEAGDPVTAGGVAMAPDMEIYGTFIPLKR